MLARFAYALSLLLLGCTTYPPDEPIPPSPELRAIEGTSWLVRRVTFQEPTHARGHDVVAGFDLDGIVFGDGDASGANCERFQPAWDSELDPTLPGVDNAGARLISTGESVTGRTFEDSLNDAVHEGRIRWAVRIGAFDEDEEHIALELFAIEEGETLILDATGLPAAGQRLRARPLVQTSALVRRSMAWGRAETSALTVEGEVLLLPFDDFRLGAFGVAAQPTAHTLYGNLGGSFSVEAMAAVTVRDSQGALDDIDFEEIFAIHADLEPSAEDPFLCTRLSVGFGFDAVPVELLVE